MDDKTIRVQGLLTEDPKLIGRVIPIEIDKKREKYELIGFEDSYAVLKLLEKCPNCDAALTELRIRSGDCCRWVVMR